MERERERPRASSPRASEGVLVPTDIDFGPSAEEQVQMDPEFGPHDPLNPPRKALPPALERRYRPRAEVPPQPPGGAEPKERRPEDNTKSTPSGGGGGGPNHKEPKLRLMGVKKKEEGTAAFKAITRER